jgi:hypothetical protein
MATLRIEQGSRYEDSRIQITYAIDLPAAQETFCQVPACGPDHGVDPACEWLVAEVVPEQDPETTDLSRSIDLMAWVTGSGTWHWTYNRSVGASGKEKWLEGDLTEADGVQSVRVGVGQAPRTMSDLAGVDYYYSGA